MATWNVDVDVSVVGESQSVNIKNFGRQVLCTEDVEVGFTEAYRVYESNTEAQNDSDLSAGAKADAAEFFSQNLRPKVLIIAAVTYASLNTDLDALLVEMIDFYGVSCADRTEATQLLLAAWALANERIASLQSSDVAITAGTPGNLFLTVQALSNNRAFGTWHDDDTESVDVMWLATILSADMDSQASVAHDKELTGASAPPSTAVDSTQKAAIVAAGGNIYLPFFGDPVMRPGVMLGGDWIEDTILNDWLEARLGEAMARLAKRKSNANSKIEYTDSGIADVEAEIRGVIDQGVRIGHFERDSLVLNVPKLADISAATRATKTITIPGTVQKTGGIKDFDINFAVTV